MASAGFCAVHDPEILSRYGGSTQRKGVTPDIIMPTGNKKRKPVRNSKITRCRGIASIRDLCEIRRFDGLWTGAAEGNNARIAKDPEFQNIMKDIARSTL